MAHIARVTRALLPAAILIAALGTSALASDVKTIRVHVVNDSARNATYGGHAEAHSAWLIGEVNQLFASAGFSPQIRIALVGQTTWSSAKVLDVDREVDGPDVKALFEAFRSWASNATLPRHDLTVLLTGDRLHDGMAGQGGTRTMCLPEKAVAVIRVDGARGDPAIVARYVAYAVGIGKDQSAACPATDTVMGVLGRDTLATSWSACSLAAWTKFMAEVYTRRKPCLETDAPPATRFGAEPRPPTRPRVPPVREVRPPIDLPPGLPAARPGPRRPPSPAAQQRVQTVALHVVNDAARARVYGEATEAHTRWLIGEVNALFAQGGFYPPIRVALAKQTTWSAGDDRGVTQAWARDDPREVRQAFVRAIQTDKSDRADLPILLTPRSLGRSLAGWGTVGTVCQSRDNAAIVKVDGSSTDVSNVARFVAQAVGITADPPRSDCASTAHIMSDVLNVRRPPTVWSACSHGAFRDFVAANDTRCLEDLAKPAPRQEAPRPVVSLGPPRDEPASLLREWPRYGRGHDVPRGIVIDDLIYLRGAARPRTPLRGSVGVLPRFMRPRDTLVFNVAHATGDARVDVTADGHLKSLSEPPEPGWLSFDGIVYGARGHVALAPATGWANHRGFAPLHYVANSGVVVMGGVIEGTGRETVLATLPVGQRPRQMTPFVVRADTGATRVIVDTNGMVRLGKHGKERWVSLSGVTFAPGPSTLVPIARPPRVAHRPATHKAGPMVHLTGDVRAKDRPMLRLPSALWPSHAQVFEVPTDEGFVRVRVTKRGRVELVARAKTRTDYVVGLDGIIIKIR